MCRVQSVALLRLKARLRLRHPQQRPSRLSSASQPHHLAAPTHFPPRRPVSGAANTLSRPPNHQHWPRYSSPARVPPADLDALPLREPADTFGRRGVCREPLSGGFSTIPIPQACRQGPRKRRLRSRISPRPSTRSTPGLAAEPRPQHQRTPNPRLSRRAPTTMPQTPSTARASAAIRQTARR